MLGIKPRVLHMLNNTINSTIPTAQGLLTMHYLSLHPSIPGNHKVPHYPILFLSLVLTLHTPNSQGTLLGLTSLFSQVFDVLLKHSISRYKVWSSDCKCVQSTLYSTRLLQKTYYLLFTSTTPYFQNAVHLTTKHDLSYDNIKMTPLSKASQTATSSMVLGWSYLSRPSDRDS